MKQQTTKKLLALLLALCLTAGLLGTAAFAASFSDVPPGHWAVTYVEAAADSGLVKGTGDGRFAPDDDVSYAEWCTMLCNLFYADEVETYLSLIGPSSDPWYLPNVIVCYQQGALDDTAYLRHAESGAGWQNDMSTGPISRFEMAQTIYNLCNEQGWANEYYMTDEIFAQLKVIIGDWSTVPDAYQMAVLYCYRIGFLMGVDSQNRFAGANTLTRGAAAAVLCRLYGATNGNFPADFSTLPTPKPTPEPTPTPTPTPTPAPVTLTELPKGPYAAESVLLDNDAGLISWPAVPGAVDYQLAIEEDRESIRDHIGPLPPVVLRTGGATSVTYSFNYRRMYTAVCTPLDGAGNPIGQPMQGMRYIMANYDKYYSDRINTPLTRQDDPQLTTITFNTWKLNSDGTKTPTTKSVTIHRDLADKFAAAFQEIFEGEEQFPIHSIGGWRTSTGEHGCGTAIDINSNENYCLYTDGRVVGSHWKPYEDPYSITPYGDVIRAFERQGFVWGGDAWRGNIDYMHFSYYGS